MPAYPLDEDRNNINGHHQVAMFWEITDLLASSLLEFASNFSDFGCPLALTIYTPQSTHIIIDPRYNRNCKVFTYTLRGSRGEQLGQQVSTRICARSTHLLEVQRK